MKLTRKLTLSLLLAITMVLVMTSLMHGQGLTASNTVLDNGKDASQRPSPWLFNPGSRAVSLITAPGPAMWKVPLGGDIYAAVDVPPNIAVGQLLTGINIDEYNRGCPQTVFFEAANHAYTIQSIASGGRTNVEAVGARQGPNGCESNNENYSVSIEYGRRRLGISIGNPEGKILLGQVTPIVFTVPPGFPVANIRIDFGAKVLLNGTTSSVFTAPADFPLGPFPLRIAVVYPSDYQSTTVRIEAVATEGIFLSSDPLFASGSGLQSTGSVVTGTNSFSTMKPPVGELLVTKRASAATVRTGTAVTYSYSVRNTTPTAVSDVSLWDSKLGEIRRVPTLASGALINVDSDPRELTSTTQNYAMASGRDPFGNVVKGESAPVTVTVIDPALELNVWDNAVAKPGVDFQLNYTVRNRGDVALNGITISDAADGWSQAFGNELEPGGEFTHTRTIRVTPTTTTRTGTAVAAVPADGGTVTAEDGNEIELRQPGLDISITADKKSVSAGDNVTFTITVKNSGDIELYDVDVSGDKIGAIGTTAVSTAKSSQTYSHTETVQRTVTHKVTANARDQWNTAMRQTADVTVTVINPLLSVKVHANGSPSSIKVNKGDKVTFTFQVTNSGDCPIIVTSVRLEGIDVGSGGDIELAVGAPMNLKATEITVDKSSLYKFTVTGKDPSGKSLSWSDQVEVQVSEGILKELQSLLANAKSLINEIERLKTRFDAVHREFFTRIGMHDNAGTNPCGDAGLLALLTEAKSIHTRIKDLVQQIQAILKEPIVAAASGVEVMDVFDFAMAAERTEPEVRTKLEEMRKKWSSLGCGETPGGGKDPAQELSFTLSGRVVDANGKGLSGASVSCGGESTTTDASGGFTFSSINAKVGTSLTITASITATDGKSYSGSAVVTYNSGNTVSVGTIRIAGITTVDKNKPVTGLTVTVDRDAIRAGESANLTAVATFDDNSTAEVTELATWTGAEKGKFAATEPGEFSVTATYKGSSGSASIKVSCADGKEWNEKLKKCIDLESAIEETKPDDEGLCDANLAHAEEDEIDQSISLGSAMLEEGRSMYQFFMKKVADQNSRVCENVALASAYAGCQRLLERYRALNERVAVLAASIMWRYGICPDIRYETMQQAVGAMIASVAAKHHEQYASLNGWLDEMRTQLQRFGCDENEVTELGNTIAENTKDPNLTGDDGTREICGDGLDNDGDGLYDEDCEQQGNYNVSIILYDSGSAKDDVFGLSVSSQGTLGNTPAGGARTYSLNLPPGSYVATVTVIVAPDNEGTFTIVVREGETMLASSSGSPGQGAIVTVPFTVSGKGGTSTFAPIEPELETVFFNEGDMSRERLKIPRDETHQSAPGSDHQPPARR
ncbi:MAG: hypothetical protein WC824_03165 [Bacteroidota bacterium]|jgi:plastocyanin